MEPFLLVFVMRLTCAQAHLLPVLMLSSHQLIFVVMVPVAAGLIIVPRHKASKDVLALELALVPLVRKLVIIQLIIMFGMVALGRRPLVLIIVTKVLLVLAHRLIHRGSLITVVVPVEPVTLQQQELMIILLVPAKRIVVV